MTLKKHIKSGTPKDQAMQKSMAAKMDKKRSHKHENVPMTNMTFEGMTQDRVNTKGLGRIKA